MQETDLREIVAWLDAGDAADYQAGVLLLQRYSKNRALVAHLLRKESASNREKLRYELVKAGCGGDMGAVHEVLNHFAQAVQGAVQQVATVLVEAHHPGVPAFPEQPAPADVPDAARPDVDAITELMGRLYTQRVQLSNRLADLDPAAAPAVVKQILSLQDQYNALAMKRRNLAEGGQPAEQAALPDNVVAALAGSGFTVLKPEQAAELLGAALEPAPASDAAPEATATEVPASEPTSPAIDRAALLQQRGNLRSNISKGKGKMETAKTEAKRLEHQEKVAKWEAELSNVELQLASPQ